VAKRKAETEEDGRDQMMYEKNPGPDWVVEYRWLEESDEGLEYMTIFGAATAEIALKEARSSLDAGVEPYVITGLQQTSEG
jgi:hypothetical protein